MLQKEKLGQNKNSLARLKKMGNSDEWTLLANTSAFMIGLALALAIVTAVRGDWRRFFVSSVLTIIIGYISLQCREKARRRREDVI